MIMFVFAKCSLSFRCREGQRNLISFFLLVALLKIFSRHPWIAKDLVYSMCSTHSKSQCFAFSGMCSSDITPQTNYFWGMFVFGLICYLEHAHGNQLCSVHPASPVLLIKNGPLGTRIPSPALFGQVGHLTNLKFENRLRSFCAIFNK